jgi:hypothetical protein
MFQIMRKHSEMHTRQPMPQDSPGNRADLDLPIFIRYRNRHFQGARLRALSSQEVEVSVQALTLPPGTPVEVEFLHSGRSWRLPAQVATESTDGLGLRFRDPQPELLRDLTGPADQRPGSLGLPASA